MLRLSVGSKRRSAQVALMSAISTALLWMFVPTVHAVVGVQPDGNYPGIQPASITGVGANQQYETGITKATVPQVGYGVQRVGAPGQPSSRFIALDDIARRRAV